MAQHRSTEPRSRRDARNRGRIAELGAGTGVFAYEAAADSSVYVVCSEFDEEASRWAREHRARPNIRYVAGPVTPKDGPFDLVVSIDVIEHIADFRTFLETCVRLAPRAILTTPNKNRSLKAARTNPPKYRLHVREWTAGEFYWVLRTFYRTVRLFSMPDQYEPRIVTIRTTDRLPPVIAECSDPI